MNLYDNNMHSKGGMLLKLFFTIFVDFQLGNIYLHVMIFQSSEGV